ncbi:hypothetical protein [Spirosoma montaniterrae]|uniref:Lipoprotein n=1 Tax=Spirosoma montaniterrae TaxID=1178516 RepID=A0A1P9X1J0_9BACT|nr:hypothetical protein [Spirosoma montaniterrae]AQG81499.1 hypothetical protein AWR27_20585 [Spirosoma montaniterrae]
MKKYSTTLIGLVLFAACYALVRQQNNKLNARQAEEQSASAQAVAQPTIPASQTASAPTFAYRLVRM